MHALAKAGRIPRVSVYATYFAMDPDSRSPYVLFQRGMNPKTRKPCNDFAVGPGGGVDVEDLPPAYRRFHSLGKRDKEMLVSVVFHQLNESQQTATLWAAILRETRDELLSGNPSSSPLPVLPTTFFDPRKEDFCGLGHSYVDGGLRLFFYRCDFTHKLRQWQLSVCGGTLNHDQTREAVVNNVMARRNRYEVHSVYFVPASTRGLEAAIWPAQQRFFLAAFGSMLLEAPAAAS